MSDRRYRTSMGPGADGSRVRSPGRRKTPKAFSASRVGTQQPLALVPKDRLHLPGRCPSKEGLRARSPACQGGSRWQVPVGWA